MNGRPRDSVVSDIALGRPALSREADRLITRIRGLLLVNEQIEFGHTLDRQVARSESWADWMAAPTRYLAEFDPKTESEIATDLNARLAELEARAKEREWEV